MQALGAAMEMCNQQNMSTLCGASGQIQIADKINLSAGQPNEERKKGYISQHVFSVLEKM